MAFEDELTAALTRRESIDTLIGLARAHQGRGLTQEAAMRITESMRASLDDDEPTQDRLMELMDYIWGWCPPSNRLWPERSLGEIRPARPEEAEALRAIEDDAGERYADVGLPGDLEGLARATIDAAIAEGTAWVATHGDDLAIAFALCELRGDALHLRELDVRRAHMGRGIGSQLLDHICDEARARGLPRVTLTTFRDVEWNAPYYARRGFEILAPTAQPAWLAAIRAEEDAGVLARWPRVAMARSTE